MLDVLRLDKSGSGVLFIREDEANPIIQPNEESTFFCPIQKKVVHWECDHTFNPAAVVHEDKVYLFYRAEDDSGQGIGRHTSRLGLAVSEDGVHFRRHPEPVLFPDNDDQYASEWIGGCEDPRIVKREDGTYVMTYTQWAGFNDDLLKEKRNKPLLGIAISQDLQRWEK